MTLHKQDSNGWTRNSGKCSVCYDIRMNGYQLDIIYCAVKEYLDSHKNQMTEGELEEVTALMEMSDLQQDPNTAPGPLPQLNGWVL